MILNDLLGEWLKTACGVDTLPDNGEELSSFYCIASSHLLRFLEPLTQEQVIYLLVFDVVELYMSECMNHIFTKNFNSMKVMDYLFLLSGKS